MSQSKATSQLDTTYLHHWDKVLLVSIAATRGYKLSLMVFAGGQIIMAVLFAILVVMQQVLPVLFMALGVVGVAALAISVMVWAAQKPMYSVILRGTWTARRVGPLVEDKTQLEELATTLAKIVRAHREENKESSDAPDTVTLAGNSVSINSEGRLENAGVEYALDGATGVRVRGDAPTGYYKLFVGVIALAAVVFVVDLVALAIIGLFDPRAAGYWFPPLYYASVCVVVGAYVYARAAQPGIWCVEIITGKNPKCVYKSEDHQQAEKVAQMLKTYLIQTHAEEQPAGLARHL